MNSRCSILVFISVLFISIASHGQDVNLINRHKNELSLKAGFSRLSIKDKRISGARRNYWAPKFEIGFQQVREHYRQNIVMSYIHKGAVNKDELLDLRIFFPSLSYSYERRIGNNWIGGAYSTSVLLAFPSSNSNIFNNNPVSYTMIHSLGPRFSKVNHYGDKWSLEASAQVGLINYVVRPAYGHPYPDQFLETGTFTPTRKGMAGPLVRSGKLLSVNKHQSFNIKFGISYFVNDHFKMDLDFNFAYTRNQGLKESTFSNTDILLGMNYVY